MPRYLTPLHHLPPTSCRHHACSHHVPSKCVTSHNTITMGTLNIRSAGLVQLSGKKQNLKLADVFGSSVPTTPVNQCKASDAGKQGTVLRGFAYLPPDARFNPTYKRRLSALVLLDCSGHVLWFPVSGSGPNFTPLSETDHVAP
eukprot:3940962-Rhodomonas_salina.1